MILTKSYCSCLFPRMLFFLSCHTDSWKALPFILYFPFFSMRFAKWHVYVTHAETPISMMWGALLRFSQRDCHSYNSGNPIGPQHQCIPPACITLLVSHPPCVCVFCVCLCGCILASLWERNPGVRSYFLQIMKAQIQSPHPSLLFDCLDKPQCVSPHVWHFV